MNLHTGELKSGVNLFQKNNLVSRMISRFFWDVAYIALLLWKLVGVHIALDFRLKITSCACFLGSGLKLVFYWKVHVFIFDKSLLRLRAGVLISWITENKGKSAAIKAILQRNPWFILKTIADQVLSPGEHLL